MRNTVKTLTLTPREPNIGEIIRYMGGADTRETVELIRDCLKLTEGRFAFRVCFTELDVKADGDTLHLGEYTVNSSDLCKCLGDCRRAAVFGATVGLEIDRLILAYGKISPSKALCLQAIGAERIEALCDSFCEYLKQSGKTIRPRFSAGYGDLSLEFQRDIFELLDCQRKIGLTLSDSLLMSPTKSVTAIVGYQNEENK